MTGERIVQNFAESSDPALSNNFPYYYFEVPLGTGVMHQEYSDLTEAIHSYLDDIVFFSSLLCPDLEAG